MNSSDLPLTFSKQDMNYVKRKKNRKKREKAKGKDEGETSGITAWLSTERCPFTSCVFLSYSASWYPFSHLGNVSLLALNGVFHFVFQKKKAMY